MNRYLENIYAFAPHLLQNLGITLFDFLSYSKRHGGRYRFWKDYYGSARQKPLVELQKMQNELLREFLAYAVENSSFYANHYRGIDLSKIQSVNDLQLLPVIDKKTILTNIDDFLTIPKNKAIHVVTGGTTGNSMGVFFTFEDIQKRWATLDSFREQFGYRFGEKTAWFSGKNLLTERDIRKNRYRKDDYLYNIRYYSTFHINEATARFYLEDLNHFRPRHLVGFPYCIFELARMAKAKNIKIEFQPVTIFSTAEALNPEHAKVMEEVFNCKVIDQYASSEGAPFINQCPHGNMHYELLSGVIEVVDENLNPADEGEILVTSFTTHGTPLIRYRIGDRVKLSNKKCDCPNCNPVVENLSGRNMDYVYSKERGKIFLPNISNTVKYARGVLAFQAIQKEVDCIIVKIVKDPGIYTEEDESLILDEWRYRMGDKCGIDFEYVNDIPKEKSGKFLMIKNEIKHLID